MPTSPYSYALLSFAYRSRTLYTDYAANSCGAAMLNSWSYSGWNCCWLGYAWILSSCFLLRLHRFPLLWTSLWKTIWYSFSKNYPASKPSSTSYCSFIGTNFSSRLCITNQLFTILDHKTDNTMRSASNWDERECKLHHLVIFARQRAPWRVVSLSRWS